MRIEARGLTHVGMRRSSNEDAFLVREDLGMCTVADGMGGAAAGEVASAFFMDAALEVFGRADPLGVAEDLVKNAFFLANGRILDHAGSHPECSGMGCTAEILAVRGDTVVIGHVGDSRTYRFRDGELRQLTVDHSLVQSQVDSKAITAEQARVHPMRHVILRAVGIKRDLEVDILKGKARPGDIFLLCSDGLTDMIEDVEIAACLSPPRRLDDMARDLVDRANRAGGKDNVTVVLAVVLP
ncbi:MAG TPA: Stp1/IreP family PP2C-type Ser/Thr phosphatase [Deltaproteobacteria bacterium]|nr:Stp1/IreP family PP2C-type Ser/Thr phosphatase [Deltaproteobacteria bacterium]HPP80618.1 Stp1/IreP family PP2C-type Ser/Thr phosphatase [Deltaproteobacteria bacterium]